MDSNEILDDKDSGPDVQINFPSSVTSRIEELMGGIDQFDSAEFDPVAYINKMFPTEQSLAGVEGAAARCEYHRRGVRGDGRRLVRAQHLQRERGQRALRAARQAIADLATQVADINIKAERSETMVREITSEIKQLDCAKSNLTAAITALNHFHMLSGGVHSLQAMTDARQYKEIVLPLQAIMEVLDHFESYRDIRELSALRDQVHKIRGQLADQIHQDFREFFSGGGGGGGSGVGGGGVSARTVSEACGVVDVLDPRLRGDLLRGYINQQLQEYVVLFSSEQECAWLPHVDKRYAWLKRHLLRFEETRAQLFPARWRLSERTAYRFCQITRSELSKLMSARRGELDVKLLLHAIQRTYNMELLLHKRFVGTELGSESAEIRTPDPIAEFEDDFKQSSSESAASGEVSSDTTRSPWIGIIGSCFEPYLSLYITSLDANLRQLMDRFIQEARTPQPGGGGAAAGGGGAAAGGGGGAVMVSCADLFLLYKKCLVQCARLSTGEPMLELCGVFAKYLREYCESVLGAALPRGAGGGAGAGAAGGGLGGGAGGAAALVSNLHTLLRDDGGASLTRYTKQEISKITSVITTSEYCLETTLHLEQKLKEKVSPALAAGVDLTPQQDLFHKLISTCIQLLVQDLEISCEPALQAMTKISWLHFDTVGDQSSYVTQIIMHLKNTVPDLRDNLSSSRKYFTQFCIRFANSFIPKFIQNIYKCKPISTVGSEQLLLDTHMLKTALLELPSIGSEVKRAAPATYTKVVIKLMTKAEMILKLVMAPLEGNLEGFVSQFVQLLPGCSVAEFHRVLDMKGARLSKAQQTALDTLFKDKTKSANSEANK